VKNRISSSFLAFCRTKEQLGSKMAIFEPQQEGLSLDQIQKYFEWPLLRPIPSFKTPAFWLNVLFQKSSDYKYWVFAPEAFRKFQVEFYPKPRAFNPKLPIFNPKFRVSGPKLRGFNKKFQVFTFFYRFAKKLTF
jgi:hypothetical protein